MFFRRLQDSSVITTLGFGFFSHQAVWVLLPLPSKLGGESLMKNCSQLHLWDSCINTINHQRLLLGGWYNFSHTFFSAWYLFRKLFATGEKMEIGVLVRKPRDWQQEWKADCHNWWNKTVNIKESCYLGNLATVGCSAEMGIKWACKYEQVKSNLEPEKLVHKCGVPQESVKIC